MIATKRKKAADQLRYQMIITWSDVDDCFVVAVPDIPGCMTHGDTYAEAVEMGLDAIRGCVEVARELGYPIPKPRSLKSASHKK